jgi:hypothetical protein
MDLVPALSLNKHPKDCENLSLVDAMGMKLSNDASVLTNEEGLAVNYEIEINLKVLYGDSKYKILAVIPCNSELVIIVRKEDNTNADIIRYDETKAKEEPPSPITFNRDDFDTYLIGTTIKFNTTLNPSCSAAKGAIYAELDRDSNKRFGIFCNGYITKPYIGEFYKNEAGNYILTKNILSPKSGTNSWWDDGEYTLTVPRTKWDKEEGNISGLLNPSTLIDSDITIKQYNTAAMKKVYDNKLVYNGGIIKGTYTYNVEGSLIIAITEYDSPKGEKNPLRTINLGKFDDDTIANDLNLDNSKLSIIPEIRIPYYTSTIYLDGSSYKGWYYLFVRYKINTVDYTKWFDVGIPIYMDDIKPQQIFRYCYDQTIARLGSNTRDIFLYNKDGYPEGYGTGCSDAFSDNLDICSKTFKVGISFWPGTSYTEYQIGIICASKTYTKAFRTFDLHKENSSSNYFTFDIKQIVEIAATDLIEEHYNYFNVKNLINYQNRLYISNYEESNANDDTPYLPYKIPLDPIVWDWTNFGTIPIGRTIKFDTSKTPLAYENRDGAQFANAIYESGKKFGYYSNDDGKIYIGEFHGYQGVYVLDKAVFETGVGWLNNGEYTITQAWSNPFTQPTNPLDYSSFNFNTDITVEDAYNEGYYVDSVNVNIGISAVNDTSFSYRANIIGVKDASSNNSQYISPDNSTTTNSIYLNIYFDVPGYTEYNIQGTIDGSGELYNKDVLADNAVFYVANDKVTLSVPHSTESGNRVSLSGVVKYKRTNTKETGEFDTTSMNINDGHLFINPEPSFNYRMNHTTLIPGEVYNFFIHYVDKYGAATNGYKLTNKAKRLDPKGNEIVPVPFNFYTNNTEYTYYALYPIDTYIPDMNYIPAEGINPAKGVKPKIYKTLNSDGTFTDDISVVTTELIESINQQYYDIIHNDVFSSYKICQIFNTGYIYNTNDTKTAFNPFTIFGKHYNNNNDLLFKVPEYPISKTLQLQYILQVSNVVIPPNYVGWFLSMEKFEPTKRVAGFLTRSDFELKSKYKLSDYIPDVTSGPYYTAGHVANLFKSDSMYFYSSKFDISDSIKLDYNIMTIVNKNCFDRTGIMSVGGWQRNIYMDCPYDCNKPFNSNGILDQDTNRYIYAMPKFKLVVADSVKDDRGGVGTALQIKDSYDLFMEKQWVTDNNNMDENVISYTAELSNVSNNLYMSVDKTLIRFTPTYYNNDTKTIQTGFNGVITYDGVLIYENRGFLFNTTNFVVYRLKGRNSDNIGVTDPDMRYYPKKYNITETNGTDPESIRDVNVPFIAYVQFPVYDTYFYESKSFNNIPVNYVFPIKGLNEEKPDKNSFFVGSIVEPKNSIDLFQNKQGAAEDFNPITYTNYRSDIVDVTTFDKTIRRSSIMQDESRVNAWRNFNIEAYKNITENKGNITNILGMGVYLIIHTEHSMFLFDNSNMLKLADQNIQLSKPDIFEGTYVEVFTSDKGYGGLPDGESWIADRFGYIFYNENLRHLFKFDNGQLSIIDEDFNLWLDKYRPTGVRIANDKDNGRILIKFNFKVNGVDKIEVFSFNYNANKLISGHPYTFDYAYNTESNLYLMMKTTGVITQDYLYSFTPLLNYCYVDPKVQNPTHSGNNIVNNIANSGISIIFNAEYETIKFVEFIKYNLRKISNTAINIYDYDTIEKQNFPYAGDELMIYSEHCSTGKLNIFIDMDTYNKFGVYNKPYFELGTWNFNYIRADASLISHNGNTRIFGNYIIIGFKFINTNKELIEFEDISVGVTKQRK